MKFLDFKTDYKAVLTRLCGPGLGIDIWINRIVSESRNKSIHLWSIDFGKKKIPRPVSGGRRVFSTNPSGYPHAKKKAGFLPHTIYRHYSIDPKPEFKC